MIKFSQLNRVFCAIWTIDYLSLNTSQVTLHTFRGSDQGCVPRAHSCRLRLEPRHLLRWDCKSTEVHPEPGALTFSFPPAMHSVIIFHQHLLLEPSQHITISAIVTIVLWFPPGHVGMQTYRLTIAVHSCDSLPVASLCPSGLVFKATNMELEPLLNMFMRMDKWTQLIMKVRAAKTWHWIRNPNLYSFSFPTASRTHFNFILF